MCLFICLSLTSPYYLSPEICEEKPYDHKSDIWAIGVVLYEMMCLKHPFQASNMKQLLMKICTATYPPIPSRPFSRELRELCTILLSKDPRRRPAINDILRLPWIQRHIGRFLSSHKQQEEFSHTVLHNRPLVAKPGSAVSNVAVQPANDPKQLEAAKQELLKIRQQRQAIDAAAIQRQRQQAAQQQQQEQQKYVEQQRKAAQQRQQQLLQQQLAIQQQEQERRKQQQAIQQQQQDQLRRQQDQQRREMAAAAAKRAEEEDQRRHRALAEARAEARAEQIRLKKRAEQQGGDPDVHIYVPAKGPAPAPVRRGPRDHRYDDDYNMRHSEQQQQQQQPQSHRQPQPRPSHREQSNDRKPAPMQRQSSKEEAIPPTVVMVMHNECRVYRMKIVCIY